jgi:lysine-N-methylase
MAMADRIVTDNTQKYSCQDCPAKCCRFPWKITISEVEAVRYRATPWLQARLDKENVDFLPKGTGYELPRVLMSNGAAGCVFLDPDNLCSIQKQLGHEAIPVACQTYPFEFAHNRAPDNPTVYPSTSFFCKSIIENYGTSIDEIIPAKLTLKEANNQVLSLPDFLTLRGKAISRSNYLMLADRLEQLFRGTDLPVKQVLLRANQELLRLATVSSSQNEIDERAVRGAFAEDAWKPAILPTERNAFTGRVLIAIGLSGIALDFLYKDKGKAYGAKGGESSPTLKYARFLLQLIQEKGNVEFWDIPKPVNLRAAKAVRIDENNPVFQAQLMRFYTQLFRSKILFVQKPDLVQMMLSLAVSYSSILRLACYEAYGHDRQEVELSDFTEAIGICALSLQHQARLDHPLKKAERAIMDMLVVRPGVFERVLFC